MESAVERDLACPGMACFAAAAAAAAERDLACPEMTCFAAAAVG